jgi:hypothetical protein
MKHLEWQAGGRECSFLPDHSLLVPTSLVVGDGLLRTSCEHKGPSHSVFGQRALLGQEIVVVGRASLSMFLTLALFGVGLGGDGVLKDGHPPKGQLCLPQDFSYDEPKVEFDVDAPSGVVMEGYLFKRASNAFKTWNR